jgi:hypothetical protein
VAEAGTERPPRIATTAAAAVLRKIECMIFSFV